MPRRKRRVAPHKAKSKSQVSLAEFNGDHGPNTRAARAGAVAEVLEGPNNVARIRKVSAFDTMVSRKLLTQSQAQAGEAIRNAFAKVEKLSSGSPLKERVQSSPKPDQTVAAQVDAQSHWQHVRAPLSPDQRAIVQHVVCEGQLCRTLPGKLHTRGAQRLREALDLVAVHLRISEGV